MPTVDTETTTRGGTEPAAPSRPAAPARNRTALFSRRNRPVIVGSLMAIVAVVLFLYWWSRVSDKTATFTSRPGDVGHALTTWMSDGTYRGYIWTTLSEAGLGFVLAVLLATALASALASSKLLAEVAAPLVSILNITPRVALAPVFLLVFGIGYRSKLYFVVAVVFIIPFYALLRALTTIDPVIKDNTRLLGASRAAMVRDVYLPAVIAAMVASLRVSISFALLSAVFAEIIASNSGIGYEIAQAELNFQPDFVIAGIVIVAVIGFVIDRILLLVERRYSVWKVSA